MPVRTLAILDGDPVFTSAIHVGRPNIGDRTKFMNRVEGILDRRWLTNSGPVVVEFEQRLAEQLKVAEVVAVCNATVGLELVIRALDLMGQVIVPSFTFVATAHALQWQEIQPVFADIGREGHNAGSKEIEQQITERTSGILGVHCWGRPSDITGLEELAEKYRLKLIFDASHAFACEYQGKPIGGFGMAEVFSFHATKFINALEGGCITTNDSALAEKLRYMRNFGFRGYDDVGYLGINGKMNEVSAAMGLTNLESLGRLLRVHKENYQAYQEAFSEFPGLSLLPVPQGGVFNHQYVVAEIDNDACPLSRDEWIDVLWAENIMVRRYFYPGCHRMEPYRSQPFRQHPLPRTEALSERVLVFPTGETMDYSQIFEIGSIMKRALEHVDEIKAVCRAKNGA